MADNANKEDKSETSSRAARKRRMELRKIREEPGQKRRSAELPNYSGVNEPKFGISSVCGRRRNMEDEVAILPCLFEIEKDVALHYYGVYDGHGCSHVATKCKERLHEMIEEELTRESGDGENKWKRVMERSFSRMDKEVVAIYRTRNMNTVTCRCELQTPDCEAVGSTAVVALITPHKIIVANCGDSRAVLSRRGRAIPLSTDHKPDRPDELSRIEQAGGTVLYWDGARVFGLLAMSRAIGDNYLKPYVCCEPEVTVTQRCDEDECLILASDGLWDVVSNEMACGVARKCLNLMGGAGEDEDEEMADKACSDASLLLTKLALARRSADNVSVVVINLKKPAEKESESELKSDPEKKVSGEEGGATAAE